MASFAENITNFNPYIQQLPVDAMTQVGMYKQQKYDEGVQKIQSYIDNVAGLDIYKDIDKGYLQSKLNELGSKLKTVAAGDFSNYQLVNSVGGMATQIVKDPIIQEALTSTKYVRKGEEELEAARKAGKSSTQNESWWRNGVGEWLNDGKIGSAFRGRYVEYRDMEKKLRDVAKEVHEYDQSIEIPYVRDNSGNVIYFDAKGNASLDPTKGVPKVDDAILKMRVKGKSAEKILDNFYISLDEDDKQQLGIDGWYHYKGYSGDQFKQKIKNDITTTFNDKKKIVSEEIVKLSVELANNSKLTTQQKEAMSAKLKRLQDLSKGGGLDKQLNDRLAQVDLSDELFLKKSVYTEKFITRLADDIAYQDMETEYKTNPYERAISDRKKLEFNYWNAQRQQANENRNYALKVAEYNLDVAKDRRAALKEEREAAEKYRELYGEAPMWEPSGLSTDKELPTIENLSSGINSLNEEMDAFRVKYASTLIPNSADLKEPEQKAALEKMLDDYIKNPKSITDNNKRKLIERYRSMSTDKARRMSNYMYVKEKSKVYDDRLRELLKNSAPITDKRGMVHKAEDATKVLDDMKSKLVLTERTTKEGPVYKKDWSKALATYKGTKYEGLLLDLMNDETYLRTFDRQIGGATSAILKEKKAFQQREIGKIMPQYQTAVTTLNTGDKGTKASVDKVIGDMYALYDSLGALDTRTKKEFDPATISDWRTGKGGGDLKYVLRKSEDNSSAYLEIYKGREKQRIPLNQRQFQKYFPSASQVSPMENIKYVINGSPMKTTNSMNLKEDSPAAAMNAAFTGEMLPLLAGTGLAPLIRFDVEGDEDNIGDENDLYQLRMYVNDNGVWKSDIVNKQGYATYGGLRDVITNIGTAEYERIKNLR